MIDHATIVNALSCLNVVGASLNLCPKYILKMFGVFFLHNSLPNQHFIMDKTPLLETEVEEVSPNREKAWEPLFFFV